MTTPSSAAASPAGSLAAQRPFSICLFCGASRAAKPEHLDLAARFGARLAQAGARLVYGGGGIGLMGAAARAAHGAGGAVLGVMPRFLTEQEAALGEVEHRFVDTMHERKALMYAESDGFLALPGGLGTLEEVIEVLSWRRLNLHTKPLIFLDEDGFWEPFFALIRHTIAENLTHPSFAAAMIHCATIEAAFAALRMPEAAVAVRKDS